MLYKYIQMPKKFARKNNLKKLENKVKRMIDKQHERKFADIAVTQLTPNNVMGAATGHITGIPQGDTSATRDGNEIRVKSIDLRYKARIHASASTTTVRVVMARMKGTVSDTAPDWNDMFSEDDVLSLKDHRLAQRFHILYDRTHVLSSNGPQIIQRKYYKKCDYKVKFNGTASSDYESGNISVWFVSDQGTNVPTVDYTTRVSYTDS